MVIKVCKTCGKLFTVKLSRKDKAKYCSTKCYQNRNGKSIIKICKTCGKSFIVQPCFKDRIYCSKNCYNNIKPRIVKICEICSCEFEVINSYNARFCSMKCQGVWQSKERIGENGANWRNNQIEIKCKYCGKIILITPCYENVKKFCCRNCHSKWMSENQYGKNHPSWQDDISHGKYCYLFNDRFKKIIRDNYNNKCFLCSKSEKENGRKLDVHHVNYNKDCLCGLQCEFVPLCQKCHGKTGGKYVRKYWEDTIMNYLYPERYFIVDI